MVEHIAKALSFGCGGGRQICADRRSVARILQFFRRKTVFGFDMAASEIGGGASENKVDVAADIAVFIELPAVFADVKFLRAGEAPDLVGRRGERAGKECILTAEKPAVFKMQPVSVGIEGNGLSNLSAGGGCIFYGKVFHGDVMGVQQDGIRTERAPLTFVGHEGVGVIAIGDHGILCVFPDKVQIRAVDDSFFPVDAARKADLDFLPIIGGNLTEQFVEGVAGAQGERFHLFLHAVFSPIIPDGRRESKSAGMS